MSSAVPVWRRTVTALHCCLLFGCASLPYTPSTCDSADLMPLRAGEPQIERGRPHALLDGLGHYVLSVPSKITLLDWKVDNHDISVETETALVEYLRANELCNVKVRLNQYSVPGEWSRLFRNRNIGGFWRYTFGILTLATYTALPQRAFGGDNYNPFTNTINIYSDVPAIVLHEGGHAKDFARRESKGLYSAVRILPIVPLWQEGIASTDAVSYLRAEGDADGESAAYPALWGAYGTYIAGEGLRWYSGPAWVSYAVLIPIAWTGKFVGWIKSLTVSDSPPSP